MEPTKGVKPATSLTGYRAVALAALEPVRNNDGAHDLSNERLSERHLTETCSHTTLTTKTLQDRIETMPAKRTLREIRRTAELITVIVAAAKRLGPGPGRHRPFMDLIQKTKEFKALPSWRKNYLQGYAEGMSAALAMAAAGQISITAEIEPVAAPRAPVSKPAPAPAPAPKAVLAPKAPVAARARVMKQLTAPAEIEPLAALTTNPEQAQALAFLSQLLQMAGAGKK